MKKLIENINDMRKSLNEISVYDLNTYTAIELYYKLALKTNEVITELSRFEGVISDEIIEQNEKLTYLLGEGLNIEVVNKINQMIADGTMDTIINHNVFNSLNNKIEDIEKIRINVKTLGLIPSENDCSELIQNIFDNYNNLYFPSGKYVISKPIFIRDNTNVLCDNDVEFFLADNSKCVMFKTTQEPHKNIKWEGGILNGNDIGQGERTTDVSTYDFTNAFRFLQVENLSVKNIIVREVRGHGIEHFNCNNVEFDNIEFDQHYDLINFPNGGGRRDGITGSSCNITYNNIRGFTDDDLIAINTGVNWHEGLPAPVKNVEIRNVRSYSKDGVSPHSSIRIMATSGYDMENVLVDNVYSTTNMPPIRIGGYDIYNGGQLKNITLRNITGYLNSPYDETSLIFIEQCHIDKLSVQNAFVINENDKKPCFLSIKNAGLDNIFCDTVKMRAKGEFSERVPFIKVILNNDLTIPSNDGGINNIYLDKCHIGYKGLIHLYSQSGSFAFDGVTFLNATNCEFDQSQPQAIVNNLKNTSGKTSAIRFNCPGVVVRSQHIDNTIQKNGDMILNENKQPILFFNSEQYYMNENKVDNVVVLGTSNITNIDVSNYCTNCFIKVAGDNVVLDSLINGYIGKKITLAGGNTTANPRLHHSTNFRLKGGTDVNLNFLQAVTFICDNGTRWVEISRNF